MAHLTFSAAVTPASVRERLTALRHAARCAERESIAVKSAVDQRLAESRACVQKTALLLLELRHVPRL